MLIRNLAASLISAIAVFAVGTAVSAETGRLTSGAPHGVARDSRSPSANAGTRRAGDAQRATEYAELIDSAAERHGLSPDLVRAIILAQSAYDPRAVSPRGARGLMQLMPSVAATLGVSDPFDPAQSIEAGTRHLRAMVDRFPDDLPRAITAYCANEATAVRYGANVPDPPLRLLVSRVLAMSQTVARERERVEAAAAMRRAASHSETSARDHADRWWRYLEDERTVVYTNIERPGVPAD